MNLERVKRIKKRSRRLLNQRKEVSRATRKSKKRLNNKLMIDVTKSSKVRMLHKLRISSKRNF